MTSRSCIRDERKAASVVVSWKRERLCNLSYRIPECNTSIGEGWPRNVADQKRSMTIEISERTSIRKILQIHKDLSPKDFHCLIAK